jgi:hypothetical protein
LAFSPRFLTPRGPNENEKKGKGSGSRLSQFSQQHRQRNKREPRQRRTTIEEGRPPLIKKKEKKKKILLYSSDVPNLGPQSITLAEPSPFFSAGKEKEKEKEMREKKGVKRNSKRMPNRWAFSQSIFNGHLLYYYNSSTRLLVGFDFVAT